MSEIIPTLCSHLSEAAPYIGISVNGNPAYLCLPCACTEIATLAETLHPRAISRLLHCPAEHARVFVSALVAYKNEHPKSDENRRAWNRINSVARYVANQHGIGTSKQPRFVRLRYGFDDGRGPSYRRKVIVPRIVEPKSLSSYSDVVAFNHVEVTA